MLLLLGTGLGERGAVGVGMGKSTKCSSAPNNCGSLSGSVSCGVGGKALQRGDMQLHLRPGKGKAARRRRRRFEVWCGGRVQQKGGQAVEQVGLDE